jgi:hypothetical protein
MKKQGINMVTIDAAGAGDIVSMAGLAAPAIGHTVANAEVVLCILIGTRTLVSCHKFPNYLANRCNFLGMDCSAYSRVGSSYNIYDIWCE